MLTTALILATVMAAADDASNAEPLLREVRQLVRQLGSGEVAERDAAEAALLDLGPPALEAIGRYLPHPDAEIDTRLTRVRAALYRKAVEAAAQPTTVTLEVKDAPLSEVLAAIEKQTGNRVVDKRKEFGQRVDDPKITLTLHDAPFWKALDATLDQAEMTTYNYSGEAGAVAIIARPLGAMPRTDRAAYSGVFRFEPTQIEAIRDLRNPANKALKLYVEVAWEPRLAPIALTQPLDALTLTNEDGGKIEIDSRPGTITADVNANVGAKELEFPLALPSRDVEKIATFEGALSVLIPGRKERFIFGNLSEADDAQQKKGSATVILQTVRKNRAIYEVRMVLRYDKAAHALESHRGWVLNNEAYLLDADGERVDHAGYETIRQTPNEVGFAYKFVIDGDIVDYKFVYESPAAVVKKQAPYVLEDIPLP